MISVGPSTASAATGSEILGMGAAGQGELALGFQSNGENFPSTVPNLQHVVQVAMGFNFTLAIVEEEGIRRAVSWGENNYGQLGVGSESSTEAPVEVHNLTGVTEVAAAGVHAMALKEGKVFTWGVTQLGESGNGIPSPVQKEEEEKYKKVIAPPALEPTEVQGLSGVKQIAAGGATDYALLKAAKSWPGAKTPTARPGRTSSTRACARNPRPKARSRVCVKAKTRPK